jgi:hypothetical protein
MPKRSLEQVGSWMEADSNLPPSQLSDEQWLLISGTVAGCIMKKSGIVRRS